VALLVIKLTYPINDMKVYVEAPMDPPSWVLAAAATNDVWKSAATNKWVTQIPFAVATNKFVSETEIVDIKQVIPWHKTILHLYLPKEIVIKSATEAYAAFSRQHIDLHVNLKKREGIWQVEGTSSVKREMDRPLNFKERIAESIPQ